MGKKFWIVYLVLAAGSGALVWYFAPDLGARLPADVRAKICSIVDSATGKTAVAVHADEKVAVHADEKVATNTPPPTAVRPSRARRTPEELGVRPVDPPLAKWGVLTGITLVEKLDGQAFGNVAGGRFLKITDTVSTATGSKVVGTFMNQQKILHPVRVPAENVLCLTGDPGLLSSNQLASLRAYYQLSGEAEKVKKDVLDNARKKAPYLQEAARALKELRAKEEAAKRLKGSADADALRKMTYEISQLRVTVQELNQKYKDWKSKNAAALPDPAKDPAYLKILERRRPYAADIEGLAF